VTRGLARGDGCPLQQLDGQARSAGKKSDGNPQHDDAARSVRAINDYIDPYKKPKYQHSNIRHLKNTLERHPNGQLLQFI